MNRTYAAWEAGHQTACADFLSGEVDDVTSAIREFHADPRDSDFVRGYLAGLLEVERNLSSKGAAK